MSRSSPKSPARPVVTRAALGARLRSIRKQQKMTLKMLSERSGIALSTISKMELGQITVSYEKFGAIAHALAVDVSSLFDAQPGSGATYAAAAPVAVKNSPDGGADYVTEQYCYRMLAADFPGKQMTPMTGLIKARDKAAFPDYIRHPGQEFVIVIRGSVTIHFENGDSLSLKRHECAYFDSGIGHVYLSTGRGDAQVVAVCSHR